MAATQESALSCQEIVKDFASTRAIDELSLEVPRGRVGYLPEERGLYPKMKLAEQLAFLGAIRGLPGREAGERAQRWLERLGLVDRADAKTDELSKGMQQKVQFAAATVASTCTTAQEFSTAM